MKYNEDTLVTLLYFYFVKVLKEIKLKIGMNVATLKKTPVIKKLGLMFGLVRN